MRVTSLLSHSPSSSRFGFRHSQRQHVTFQQFSSFRSLLPTETDCSVIRERYGYIHYCRIPSAPFIASKHYMTTSASSATKEEEEEELKTRTRYTIDETTCPPTNTATLQAVLTKHVKTLPLYLSSKPIPKHTLVAFEEVKHFISYWQQSSNNNKDDTGGGDIVLDSGCGTGKSTLLLAEQYPNDLVIGIDRSFSRLTRNKHYKKSQTRDTNEEDEPVVTKDDEKENESTQKNTTLTQFIEPNILLVRAELVSFWQCLYNDNSDTTTTAIPKIKRHYLLYPNPYPKLKRLQSRWYGHASFPLLMNPVISGEKMVVRSNWKGYLEEFGFSANFVVNENESEHNNNLEGITRDALLSWQIEGPRQLFNGGKDDGRNVPLTNFEKKYVDCGEPVYELILTRH